MFSTEIWDKLLSYCDLLTMISISQVNQKLNTVATSQIRKMKEILCGTFVSFKKEDSYPDDDVWNMKKIILTIKEGKLLVKNLHSWSSNYSVTYDKLVNIDTTLNIEKIGNSCKLEMSDVVGSDKNSTMMWTNHDTLHQTLKKLGEEDDGRIFTKVFLDDFHYLCVNDDDSNSADNSLFYVTISPANFSSLNITWPNIVLLRVGDKEYITKISDMYSFLRRPVREEHIRVSVGIREMLRLDRGETLEVEPLCGGLPHGTVDLKITAINRFRQSEVPVDFGKIVQ